MYDTSRVRDALALGLSMKAAPGAAVHICGDDDAVTLVGGERQAGKGEGLTSETAFPIGCLSKLLISILCMQLSCEGSLDLDRRVVELLPELDSGCEYRGALTVRHLLAHAGGFLDPPEKNFRWACSWPRYTEFMAENPNVLEPGLVWSYSQTGHCILARIVERILDLTIEQAIRERIFAPLGIAPVKDKPSCAPPHVFIVRREKFEAIRMLVDNGILSDSISPTCLRVTDIAKIGLLMLGETCGAPNLLPAEYRDAMLTTIIKPASVSGGPRAEVLPDGYGLGIGRFSGSWGHNGSYLGTTISLRVAPAVRRVAVVALNAWNFQFRDHLTKLALVCGPAGLSEPDPEPASEPPSMGVTDVEPGVYQGLMMGSGCVVVKPDGDCIFKRAREETPARLVFKDGRQTIQSAGGALTGGFISDPSGGKPILRLGASCYVLVHGDADHVSRFR